MFSSVNSFLGFDRGCIGNRECLIIGQNEENGNFVLHQVLSAAVKEKRPVCLVSFVQKFHHYNAVSLKTGVSLQSATEAKQLQFIDGLEELVHTFFPETYQPVTNQENFLDRMKEKLLKSLCCLKEQAHGQPVLVIDDISVFLSMGYHLDEVMMFFKALQEALWFSLDASSSGSTQNGTTLVVLTSYDQHDRDTWSLWKFLTALSSLDVNVTGLQTGYCKDVHGQVWINPTQNSLRVGAIYKDLL